ARWSVGERPDGHGLRKPEGPDRPHISSRHGMAGTGAETRLHAGHHNKTVDACSQKALSCHISATRRRSDPLPRDCQCTGHVRRERGAAPPPVALVLSVLLLAGCGDDGFRPLVSLPRDFDAAWSPDGQRIAFRHEQGDQGDEPSGLYVLNADGTGRRLLVPDAGMPTWSPDGRFLIYIDRGSGALEVHRLDLETLQSTPVLSGGDPIHWYPAWSRDGKRLAFASSISTPSRCCSLHLMNPDGTDIRRIRFEGDDSIGANRPMWSPDGRRLVFEGFPRTGEEVVVVDTTGENLRRLTKGKFPSWCPVCEWIVFVVHERTGRGAM